MNNKNDIKRLIMLIIIGVIAYLMISNFGVIITILSKLFSALFPFILGFILAFILNIPMTKIENLLKKIQKNNHLKKFIFFLFVDICFN